MMDYRIIDGAENMKILAIRSMLFTTKVKIHDDVTGILQRIS